jgi:hypothetical protein
MATRPFNCAAVAMKRTENIEDAGFSMVENACCAVPVAEFHPRRSLDTAARKLHFLVIVFELKIT